MKIAKVGDLIQWDFKGHIHEKDFPQVYRARVAMVDEENYCYGVYAEYGQDLIVFGNAEIIEEAEEKEPMILLSKAFEFTEWCSEYKWEFDSQVKLWFNKIDIMNATTQELFEMFNKEIKR